MGSATATSNWIRCPQCDGDVLIAAEYVTKSTVRAPALKCARCKMLHLDEAVARSPDERESVRMAKAERAALSASDSNLAAEPQTFEGPDLHSNTFEAVADRVGQPGGRVLLVDDEDIVRAGHGQVLTRAGWTVVAEGDARLAAKRLAVESFDVIVTDLVMPSMSGLDLLRTAREYDLDVPVVILTGRPDVQSAMEAMQYGAFRYIDKPVLPATLVDVVGRARDLHMMASFKREALSVLELPNRALGDRAGLEVRLSSALDSLWVAYQPIVAFEHRQVLAYEALVRNEEPTLRSPLDLFDAAERLGRLHEVARRIRSRVAADARGLPEGVLLFVNVHPEDLNDFDLFSPSSALSEIANRVVLELTERASLDRVAGLQTRIGKLRELGFRIALDDLGAGYAGLSSFTLLQPDYVKLDASLIRSVDASPQKRSIVRAMLQLAAGDLNLKAICEGVETAAERDTLVALGGDLLQGYLFARPNRGFVDPQW
jgi:EAL domain-containing protein (putative c-di-GMP-specific phosphodiesterase class I)/ActR/RegA family two-component response regulator